MSRRSLGWVAVLLGGVIGCEDPGPIVPVTPPGASLPKESPDVEPAQAVGEMAAAAPKQEPGAPSPANFTSAPPTKIGEKKTTPHGVVYETLKEGTGPELKYGQTIRAHYEGKLQTGAVFDTTRTRNQPRIFKLVGNELIEGWVEALPGMKAGEIRRLTIPPAMGYGKQGRPPVIPPDSTLIFEIELMDIL